MVNHYLRDELFHLLREDESIFQFIEKSSLDGIWFWDIEDNDHKWMSDRFWTTLGIDPSTKNHLASEWQECIFPDDYEIAMDNFHKHCADPEHPYDQIVRYRHRDGSTVWIRCRGFAIRDENGTARRMLGAHNDVTEIMAARENFLEKLRTVIDRERANREKLEDQLRRREQEVLQLNNNLRNVSLNLSKALEGITNAILIADPSGQIVYCNSAASTLFRYGRNNLIGMNVDQLVPAASRPQHTTHVRRFMKNPTSRRMGGDMTVHGVTSDGEERILDIGLSPIEFDGVDVVLVHAMDITERAQTAGQLIEANQELERSNRELENFARVLAHDLRDPIGRIKTLSEMLDMYIAQRDTQRITGNLDLLKKTSEHAIQLITDIYSYVIVHPDTTGDTNLNTVDLSDTLAQALDNLSGKLRDVEVLIGDVNHRIKAIKSMGVQVIQNIVSNAVRYGPVGETVIKIDSQRKNGTVCLTITDNGPGIPDDARETIFAPFSRLHHGANDSGLGLGLATARKNMSYLGGQIWCDNPPDGGACFNILFRAAD